MVALLNVTVTSSFFTFLTMTIAFGSSGSTSSMLQRACLLLILLLSCDAARDDSRNIQLINDSGFKIEVYWINRWKNDELVINTEEGVMNGASTGINSFVGHEFQIVEVPSKKTGKCREEECKTATFQVNANDGQSKSSMSTFVDFLSFHKLMSSLHLHSRDT